MMPSKHLKMLTSRLEKGTMHNAMKTGLLTLAIVASPAFAQMAPQEDAQTISKPGKVSRTNTVKSSVVITKIDKSKRLLTLKNSAGQIFDVIADNEVRNFDQIAVGDTVTVEYVKSLTMQLKKPGTDIESSATGISTHSQPGEKPGGTAASSVTTVTDVIDVNPEKKTITLQGPQGHIVELDVKNPDQFKTVKKGDKVEVTYMEAVAVAVEPAAKKAAK
jgi:hypothetical protein